MRILIIPWFRANNIHVNKYINMYKKIGVDNVDVMKYSLLEAFSHRGWKKFRKRENIAKYYDVVHTFSGGSLIAYNLLKNNWEFKKLIFDSGPMFPTEECSINYLIGTKLIPESSRKFSEKTLSKIWTLDYSTCPEIRNDYIIDYKKTLFPSENKKLIINSTKDTIILPKRIEEIIDNNSEVISYENSNHVCHYRENKNHYKNVIYKFINKPN